MGRKYDGLQDRQPDEATLKVLQVLDKADDPRQAWGEISRRIDTLRKTGREVPEALVVAERQLMTEFMAESQGR